MITVVAASQEYYRFSLIEPSKGEEVYREKIETIGCRLDRALEAFDEIVAKLRKDVCEPSARRRDHERRRAEGSPFNREEGVSTQDLS